MSLDLNSSSVEYKGNKVVIKSIPKEGENLSVFMRPGDEVIFEIDGFDPDTLEYILVGGDIVVSFTGEGLLTFPSLGLMGFSSNPPLFSFGGNKSISVDNILSKIEEVNELPITSVDASFKVTTSNKNEDEVPFGSKTDEATQTQVIVVPQTQSFSDTQSKREDFSKTEQNSATTNFSSNSEPISNSTLISSTYTNPYSEYTKPNDFDAYKPEIEMIPKPDVEMIPKPDGEMIPKPDGEMIPKPDGEMIPENDFTDYFPENDFDGYGDGYGNGDGDGDGEGPGEGVPSFGFKATAHQVRFSETTNDEGQVEILGGGGSINGYKFDSITNQFEPETIDMSTRSENMVIRAENSTYFSDTPSAPRGINTITFKDLIKGQSVTVDGLTLTAKDGDISASSVATAFASLSAGATAGNSVTGGSWDGNLSNGWSSDPLLLNSVTFTSQTPSSNVDDLAISDSQEAITPTLVTVLDKQGNETTTETYTLTFKDLVAGQSVSVGGLIMTATDNISGSNVATAFASISSGGTGNSVSGVSWDGSLSADWASGAVFAINSDVTFKSTEENSDISSFSASSAGLTIDAPTAPDVVSTDGGVAQIETHALTFEDLNAGQSITVDGLTLTASDTITAANVAAAFADLAADSTGLTKSGGGANTVTNGDFSGKLSDAWASDDITGTSTVTFASTTVNENVTDIAISYAGSTIDAPEEIDIISSQDVAYLSRVLRFEPNMPEGFYVDSFLIEGLPTGVAILDKDANEITSSNITKDDMIFKNELGEIIAYDSADFLTSFKSLEFTIKYPNDIVDPFNLSITANYKIDEAYADSVTEPEQSYTNEYTFALKDIKSASDYTYNKGEFSGGLDDGFILAKEPNYNIIKDGSGDSIIYGGVVKDIIYDGAGDDTYYLSAGDDLVYGGSGTNYIYGDRDNDSAEAVKYKGEDSVSYELVQSFESSEVKLLAQNGFISPEENQKLNPTDETADDSANTIDIEMLASYKGVYVDLDGVHIEGLDIDVNGDGEITEDDKINTISKFANRVGKFTYDEDGNAISSTIGENITFTSVTQGAAVVDIVVTSAGALEVAAPAALGVATTPGVAGTQTQEHTLAFEDLIAGQSVTIDGLKLTATDNITAAEIAAGFANLGADATSGNALTNGKWSGAKTTAWASGAIADTATVTFTSKTLTQPVTDIVISTSGMSAVAAPEDVEKSAIQGDDLTTEQHNIVFKDLIAGQSVSVGGLTLTASAALSAREIAAAYANLSAGATEGNDVTGLGSWSGTFSSAWTSGAQEQIGLDNLQATGYDILEDIENIIGSNYSDTIYGNADKDNILTGLKGGDILDGRGGENKLYGGDGYDILYSGSGNDYIDGGGDTDTVNYQNVKGKGGSTDAAYSSSFSHNGGISVTSDYVANGVTVRLDRPDTIEEDYATFINKNGESKKDTLISIEDVVGSNYDDAIFGSSSTNYIEGMGGNDLIFSGGGINFIDGGDGSDKISYNAKDYKNAAGSLQNTNYIDYLNSIDGINVTLGNDFVMIRERNGANKDRLIDLVKNIEEVSGTKGNDYIRGTSKAEKFWGNDGDDYIRPGGGIDYSWGGEGTDYIELYDDGLIEGYRILKLTDEGTIFHSQDATQRDAGTWTEGYNAHGGINYAYEFEGFGGSNHADTMFGNIHDNVLNGHGGDDEIYGMGGDDFIRGGNGDDLIYGGDGDDTIYGDGDNDIIYGGDGDDTVYGYSVYDWKNTNQDIMDGGSGVNTLNYSLASHGGFTLDMRTSALDAAGTTTNGVNTEGYASVIFNASGGSNDKTKVANAYNDKVKNFQTIIGSRDGDTIYANDTGMTLDGWSGVDKLYGGADNDTIIARNQTGEILDGGGGTGTDTLKLAQSVNFTNANASAANNITVSDFEILDLGSTNYYARLNINQWNDNNFEEIIGGANTRLFLHSTNNDETFDFEDIDFSGFSGAIYTYGYSGADTVDLTNVKSIDDVKFYLDGGANSDTLKIGTETSNPLKVKLLDNNYNSFETFEIAKDSTLEVNAYNNSGRRFYADTKDFTKVDGDINFIGGNGNDTFYANYKALLDGKLTIDGGTGSDMVDVRASVTDADLSFNNADMFANIEMLRLTDSITRTNNVEINAEAMKGWFEEGSLFQLDLYNQTQANNVTISNAKEISDATEITGSTGSFTGFEMGKTYDITLDDTSFQMQVV